jgi:glycosyltransferase involved in cell wall biosynthesis
MAQIKVLILYRGKLSEPRGTPIRVSHFVSRLASHPTLDLSVFSWDKIPPVDGKYFYLDNNHVKDIKKICAYIKKNHIQVVIGYIASSLYYLIPIKLLTGVKIIYESQGFIEEEARAYGDIGFLKYYFFKILFGASYWMCDTIVTSEGPHTIKKFLKYNKNTVDLYGGVDLSVFSPDVSHGVYIKKDSKIIIGYAGNARVWQGLDFLVDSYGKISSESDDFRLALALSEKREYDRSIEVVGPLPNNEVPKFMIDCDILVIPRPDMPAMRYAVSGKLIEYLGMGKAIIVSNVGDVEKVITHGVNGLIYTAGDMNEFIKCIFLLRNKKKRDYLGANALKTAQDYTWDKLAIRLIDEVHKLT